MEERQIELLGTQAMQHLNDGKPLKALELLQKILNINSSEVNALKVCGYIYALEHEYEKSIESLKRVLEVFPKDLDTLHNLGKACFDANRYQDSIGYYTQCVNITGQRPDILTDIGTCYAKLGDQHKGLEFYDAALKSDIFYLEAWNNRVSLLIDIGALAEAEEICKKSLQLIPNNFLGLSNLGSICSLNGNYADAIDFYRKALSINMLFEDGWVNLGNALFKIRKYTDALDAYKQALKINPLNGDNWLSCANIYFITSQYGSALTAYDEAIKLEQNLKGAKGMRLSTAMSICSWQGHQNAIDQIYADIQAGHKNSLPFTLLTVCDSPELQKKLAESWDLEALKSNINLANNLDNNQKIHIGYYSSDFDDHPVGHLIANILELHDRNKFVVSAFSYGGDSSSSIRQRIKDAADFFHDVQNFSDVEIALFSQKKGVHIAVDLNGLTRGNRSEIFRHRAAPIQINYLGYPGTMGSSSWDYIIADQTVIPSKCAASYTERIIYLPEYFPHDSKRKAINCITERSQFELPEDGFIFCAFNNAMKITPIIFECWMKILMNVKDSYLWLSIQSEEARSNLRYEAKKFGVSSDRLIFADKLTDRDVHLSRYCLADLFLDTFPYGAHTTAGDALWAGLPLVTLKGQSFASRVASSMLCSLGLDNLVANSEEEYIDLACTLAKSPQLLASARNQISTNRCNAPIYQTNKYVAALEREFEAAISRVKSAN